MGPFTTIIPAGLVIIALLISLGFQTVLINRLLGVIFLITGTLGLYFYGYAFYTLFGASLIAIMRTVFAVFCMFLGRNEISVITSVPGLNQPAMLILIYLIHLLALYVTASALVANVGTRLLRSLNLLLLFHRKIDLIFGVNETSISFAQKLPKDKNSVTVFVDPSSSGIYDSKILQMGSIPFNDISAQTGSVSFLKKINMKPGTKKLDVYCLDESEEKNLTFAENLKNALIEAGIQKQQCRLTVLLENEIVGGTLQADTDSACGFGTVTAMERHNLITRMMVRNYPPSGKMEFLEHGRAAEDFDVLIVGFGRMGQSVLRTLIMNAQFCGSNFHAAVIARDYTQAAGAFFNRYKTLAEKYKIDFMEVNARGLEAYSYLSAHAASLNYVVVCTGDEHENSEIAGEYENYLKENSCRARVLQCSLGGITSFSDADGLPETVDPFVPEILCDSRLDAMAMIINHKYNLSKGNTAEEDWEECDYFSRMSCRASADAAETFLAAAGMSREELAENGWPADDPELMTNLAVSEHMRWCAFHYAMGYNTMPESVFRERAKQYAEEMKAYGKSGIRPGKDTENKLHACLIDWEQLPALSELEYELTGKRPDYRQMDLDNVEMLPEMIRESDGIS